jgi:hypothetical protein
LANHLREEAKFPDGLAPHEVNARLAISAMNYVIDPCANAPINALGPAASAKN